MKLFLGLLGLIAAAPLYAQAQVEEGAAIKPLADVMREAWRKSPVKPVSITVPLFDRLMLLDMVRGFVPAYKAQNARQFIFEFLPDGETFDNWSRMVTVTAARGAGGAKLSDLDLAASILANPAGCAKGPFYRALGRRDMGGGVSVVTVTKGCAGTAANAYPGAAGSLGEQSLILHFRDAQNTYSVQYAVRGKFAGGQPLIPDGAVAGALNRLGTVRLCSPGATDKPCQAALLLDKRRANGR